MVGLAWDEDVRLYWSAVESRAGDDVVLSVEQEEADKRIAGRINRLWSYGNPLAALISRGGGPVTAWHVRWHGGRPVGVVGRPARVVGRLSVRVGGTGGRAVAQAPSR